MESTCTSAATLQYKNGTEDDAWKESGAIQAALASALDVWPFDLTVTDGRLASGQNLLLGVSYKAAVAAEEGHFAHRVKQLVYANADLPNMF